MNDGGMFYSMILDLQKNNFSLPFFTSYNFSNIPYAYPPLSFYVAAILNEFLGIDLVSIFRYFPLFFNLLSIPAFYLLANEITLNERQSIIATAFYAILIPGYEWLITGGGLTRSPAQTYFILSLSFFINYGRTHKKSALFFSILTSALMTWHHLEYCWLLMFSLVIFCVRTFKFKECIQTGLIYLAGFLIITGPYWAIVITRHGFAPILSAVSSGEFDLVKPISRLILMVYTEESLINYVNVLAIFGLLYCLFSGKHRIVIWFLLISFLNPRSANRSLIFPVSIFASIAIDSLICPELDRLFHSRHSELSSNNEKKGYRHLKYSHIFILFSILYPFFLGFLNALGGRPVLTEIKKPEIEAMNWIKNNTPADSTFIVLNNSIAWSMDKTGEWFPTLAQRKSQTTVQGTEWLTPSSFESNKEKYNELKKCINIGASCLETWIEKNQVKYDYLYLSRDDCQKDDAYCLNFIETSIRSENKYEPIFENSNAVVFKLENFDNASTH